MFICNLQSEESEMKHFISATSTPQPNAAMLPQKRSGCYKKDCAYRFEALSHLLGACGRLARLASMCESAAYRDEKGSYFLLLTVLSPSPFSLPDELEFIVEYGSIENASMLRLYIREHAKAICESNAVTQLAQLL